MLKESIPTCSASTASSTALRMAWSPPIGRPDSSTVTGRNVSRPNSSWCIVLTPQIDYLTTQTSEGRPVFHRRRRLAGSGDGDGGAGLRRRLDAEHAEQRVE